MKTPLKLYGNLNKTIVPLTLVGYQLMIADLVLCTPSGFLKAVHILRAFVEQLLNIPFEFPAGQSSRLWDSSCHPFDTSILTWVPNLSCS